MSRRNRTFITPIDWYAAAPAGCHNTLLLLCQPPQDIQQDGLSRIVTAQQTYIVYFLSGRVLPMQDPLQRSDQLDDVFGEARLIGGRRRDTDGQVSRQTVPVLGIPGFSARNHTIAS